ncbi:hypothetical protein [Azospirillum aestuarii]|uniref:hypothetical protein n=1 Tax=Azospirillum aestuarii TaxID=2802052 RepID=UPI004054F24A
MEWLKIVLPDDVLERDARWQVIMDAFENVFLASGGPRDAAMFSVNGPNSAEAFIFSPASNQIAGRLLHSFGAVPSERPNRQETTLLVGNADAVERLLAE